MHDFVSVTDRLPENGQEVEALRDYGCVVMNPSHRAYGCRFGIERTFYKRGFACDIVSTGKVTHWRPAGSVQVATGNDYESLRDLIPE